MKDIEEGSIQKIDFKKITKAAACGKDLIIAIAQDVISGEVLVCGFADQSALRYTLANKIAAFWSTSRNELWIKGKTSGSVLHVKEVRVNCEQNSVLYLVESNHGACHTKDQRGNFRKGCYYRKIHEDGSLTFVDTMDFPYNP